MVISQVDDRWLPIKGTEKVFKCDTVLFSVGLIPENEISLKAGVILDRTNGPAVNEYLETNISGIFASGNVLQVHDLVDWVTIESEKAGKNAAEYAKGIERPSKLMTPIKTIPNKNVGYILPQRIEYVDKEKLVQFSMRPRFPDKNVVVQFISKNNVFYSKKLSHVIPSEMINLTVNLDIAKLSDSIEVNIVPSE